MNNKTTNKVWRVMVRAGKILNVGAALCCYFRIPDVLGVVNSKSERPQNNAKICASHSRTVDSLNYEIARRDSIIRVMQQKVQ